ncbi:hypothetical protein PV328_009614 [Microctonus aethiopoides]|uniref:Uncharacterized protein n=1 Tax=Microctonus aethiopoides TaxID=144406 RepID=A0AA39C6F7_9HYME|nr:hypothetical protein PV328_009614 [Microctonus aethiopoides]
MKLFIVLFAVVAAAAAFPGYEIPWQSSGWQSQPLVAKSGWQSGWQKPISHGWQQPISHGWQPQPIVVKTGWQQPINHGWQQPISHGWQQPISHGWQQPISHGWNQHHHVHHVDAIHVPQQPAIPPLHPHPLKLDSHTHVTRIHYDHPHIPHPHLIGYEVAVHEPEVKHVIKPVHHEHHGY